MASVTVVIHDARDPVSARIVEVLADWSASGWLDGYVLLSVQELDRRGHAIGLSTVVVPPTPGGPGSVRTFSRVAGKDDVRLVVLDPVGDNWPESRALRHAAAKYLFDGMSRRVGAIDLIIAWHGARWEPSVTPWPGWDTLVAAPQESGSPEQEGFDLFGDTSDSQALAIAAHAAAFTATAAALWVGVSATPWDHSGRRDDVRMARAFHARLDASEVERLLSELALSPTALRAPGALPASEAADFTAVVDQLRGQLELLATPAAPREQVEDVGARRAVALFFSFMFRSLVRAPSEMARSLAYQARSRLASGLTGAIYGDASSKRVSVSGVTARPGQGDALRRATASESGVTEILARFRDLDLQVPEAAPPAAQERFWRSTIHAALALASGERQPSGQPVIEEGAARYFPTERIVPADADQWRPLEGVTLSTVRDEVPLNDLLTCHDALAELRELSSSYSAGREEVEANRRDLERAVRSWRQSFFGTLGAMIVDGVNHHRSRLKSGMDRLAALGEPATTEAEDLAGDLSRFMRITTLVAVVIGAVLGILSWRSVFDTPAWIWVPCLVVAWFVAVVVKYLSIQRRIYQLLHRAREHEHLAVTLGRELPVLVENLRRLLRVYAQYLMWSRLAAVFLREPFGRPTAAAARAVPLVGFVPPSVVIGRYVARDPADAHLAVTRLGWDVRMPASGVWDEFVRCSFEALADRPEFISSEPDDVFRFEDARLARWLEVGQESADRSSRMSKRLATALHVRHKASLARRTGPERLGALARDHFAIESPDGRMLAPPGSGPPARFRLSAFSIHGLAKELATPDPEVGATWQGARESASEGYVLDDVLSVLVATRQLSFQDLELKAPHDDADAQREGPAEPSYGVRF